MKLREGLDGHCPVKKISVMPPECRQPKLYRVWRRPHGGCQRKHPNASAAEQYQRKGEQLKEGTHPSRPADPCETERFVKGPVANGTIQETETPSQKQGESTESSTMVPESHKLSVRFSPNVSLASLPSAARTPSIPRGSLSHSQKVMYYIRQVKERIYRLYQHQNGGEIKISGWAVYALTVAVQ